MTWLPPLSSASGYRSPARGDGDPPSEADDAWAVAALLGSDAHRRCAPRRRREHGRTARRRHPRRCAARGPGPRARQRRSAAGSRGAALETRARALVRRARGRRDLDFGTPTPPLATATVAAGCELGATRVPASVMPTSVGHVPAVASSTPPSPRRGPRGLTAVLGAALAVGLLAAWAVSAIRRPNRASSKSKSRPPLRRRLRRKTRRFRAQRDSGHRSERCASATR